MNKVKKKTISKEDVLYVSHLSRLKIDHSQIDQFQDQMATILGYIDQLNELNTEDTLPTSHVLSSMKNVFREDILKKSLTNEEALQNAPEKEKNFFKVTRIIKDS